MLCEVVDLKLGVCELLFVACRGSKPADRFLRLMLTLRGCLNLLTYKTSENSVGSAIKQLKVLCLLQAA